VTSDGTRLGRVADETRSEEGPAAVVERCIQALRGARDLAAAVASDLVGVGISSPGPVDPFRGIVVDPPNLGAAFHDVALAPLVGDALGLPAALDRDTNVAALGEWTFGVARGCSDFLYVTVSTGIGGAVVSGGRLLRGPDGTAGELGHTTVDLDGPVCGCGARGHLEAISSGRALARDARAAVDDGRSPFLSARAAQRPDVDARAVADGEAAGDETCRDLMVEARRAFAAAVVSWVDLFDPELIVVGGSIAEHQGDRLLDPARAAVERHAFRAPASRVRIVTPGLGPDVSLAGAHPLVMSRLHGPVSETVGTALVGHSVPA
jgi:glucokinase